MKQEHFGFVVLALLLIGGLFLARMVGVPGGAPAQISDEAVSSGELIISGAWVAAPVTGQPATAAYLTIQNNANTDERLTGIATPIATMSHLHRSVVEDNVSRMEGIDALILPANGEVVFAPGGLHIMLMGLDAPLAEGDRVELTLQFLETGDVMIEAPVRARDDMMDMN
jgi:copper(I)-binding protein